MERNVVASVLVGVGLHVFVIESLNRSPWTWMIKIGVEAPELQLMPLLWNAGKAESLTSRVCPHMELYLLQSDSIQQCTSLRTTAEDWCLNCIVMAHALYCCSLKLSDLYIFPKLKEHRRGRDYLLDIVVKTVI
jgi:hypothetical protein